MSRSPAKSTLNNMSVKKPDYESKIVLAGDTDVGKSQIINRIVKGSFSDNPQATIGIEYGYRKMTVQNKVIKMEFWDTPSRESRGDYSKMYFRNSSGLILVFDVSRADSFEHMASWYSFVNEVIDVRKIPVVVVGNKIDLDRKVSTQQGKEFADTRLLPYFQVSAKENKKIQEFFQAFARQILRNQMAVEVEKSIKGEKKSRIQLDKVKPTTTKSNCC